MYFMVQCFEYEGNKRYPTIQATGHIVLRISGTPAQFVVKRLVQGYPRKNSATKSLMFWSCFELTSNHCHIFEGGNFRCHLCQPRHAGILTAVVHVCVEKLNSHKKSKTTYIHCCPCPSPSRFYGVCRNLVGAEYQKGVSGVSHTFSHGKKQ